MEREANIALGRWYRTSWDEESRNLFLQKLEELTSSPDRRDRNQAFHLIRHTQPTDGENEVFLNEHFHPLLEAIFLDPDLQRTVELFKKDFKANLKNFSALERKREQIVKQLLQKELDSGKAQRQGERGPTRRPKRH